MGPRTFTCSLCTCKCECFGIWSSLKCNVIHYSIYIYVVQLLFFVNKTNFIRKVYKHWIQFVVLAAITICGHVLADKKQMQHEKELDNKQRPKFSTHTYIYFFCVSWLVCMLCSSVTSLIHLATKLKCIYFCVKQQQQQQLKEAALCSADDVYRSFRNAEKYVETVGHYAMAI